MHETTTTTITIIVIIITTVAAAGEDDDDHQTNHVLSFDCFCSPVLAFYAGTSWYNAGAYCLVNTSGICEQCASNPLIYSSFSQFNESSPRPWTQPLWAMEGPACQRSEAPNNQFVSPSCWPNLDQFQKCWMKLLLTFPANIYHNAPEHPNTC